MVKRRSPKDYDPEVERFEEWLEINEGKSLIDVKTTEELIKGLEGWFEHIDMPGIHQSPMAKSMIAWMLDSKQIGRPLTRPVRIVKLRERVTLLRKRAKWTRREEGLLRWRYQRPQNFSVETIAKRFGRSKKSIYSKARKLKVKRRVFVID